MGLQKVTERWMLPFAYRLLFGSCQRLGCGISSLKVSDEVIHRRLALEVLRRSRWPQGSQHFCQYGVPVQFAFPLLAIGLPSIQIWAGVCALLSLDCFKENWGWIKSECRKSFLCDVSSVEEETFFRDNSNTIIHHNGYIQISCYPPNTVINLLHSHLVVAY